VEGNAIWADIWLLQAGACARAKAIVKIAVQADKGDGGTMNLENERLLVIAPHADDEVLGCFSLMKLVTDSGGKAYVQVMTLGGYQRSDDIFVRRDTWRRELEDVCTTLHVCDFDIMLDDEQLRSLDELRISQIIRYVEHTSPLSVHNLQPTIVAIPTLFSSHQDHGLTYKAAIAALRTNPVKGRVQPRMILSYEAPEYNLWSQYLEMGAFIPNLFLPMSPDTLKHKCEALACYQSQLKEGKRGMKAIKIHASTRGYQSGHDYAEGFNVQKLVLG
jgi:LmbE family N-acetylglucosaminyl deacetylase